MAAARAVLLGPLAVFFRHEVLTLALSAADGPTQFDSAAAGASDERLWSVTVGVAHALEEPQTCFNCVKPGHYANDCWSARSPKPGTGPRGRRAWRAYLLAAEAAHHDSSVGEVLAVDVRMETPCCDGGGEPPPRSRAHRR